ncbi:MAG: rhodanese-like domain-containing protein [Phycisphaerae bacterium]|nr:rhodanese-like domain-containing protein [Phycisphaerae bacterium]
MTTNLRAMLLLAGVLVVVSNPCALAHIDVTVEQARELIASTNDLTVVDVRERYEYCDAKGHIPGALNYPWSSGVLRARYEERPIDGPVLVVCQSGGRSNAAASFLDSNAFSTVYDMMGGMSGWQWETAPCKYTGGSGTADDPYQIATAADLIALGETPEDYDKHFILTADIDLDPNLPGRRIFDKAVVAPDTDTVESGFQGTPFTGVFDGNGHMVSRLTIAGESYVGLFAQLSSGAMISNVGLEAVDVNGAGSYVGGLVGSNSGSIAASYSTDTVTGNMSVGGLVGENRGSITSSYSTGTVTGNMHVGGLAGYNSLGSIATSYSTATVTGNTRVGGLVGQVFVGSISITTSFWDMETSGQTTSAGGTGLTTAGMQDIDIFLSEGWDFVDEIRNGTCDYWQISPGDYPRLRYHAGDSPVMPEGLGTAHQPHLIRNARDMGTVWFKPSAHYRLEASVDLSGITWSMAVVPWFEGTFDGNGYVISDLHIQGGGHLGLFGQLASGAMIFNLGLEAVDVNGVSEYVGGLVGSNAGSITSSYCTGTVTGNRRVGGLAGWNYEGSITASYSTGAVTGNDLVGGLAGWNHEGSIAASYSTGTVTGNMHVGGLIGENRGSITTSYSTGAVTGDERFGGLVGLNRGSITSSFWDMETSGQTDSGGGTGLTTAKMQTASTFLDAGWDFVDETENGTEDTWWILEGQDYPRLWWETDN